MAKNSSQIKFSDYGFELPEGLIAQRPLPERDASRLMVLHRRAGEMFSARFRDLPDILQQGDCLILNDTKVIPARLAVEKPTGARTELLLVRELEPGLWEAMIKRARRVKPGARLRVSGSTTELIVEDGTQPDRKRVRFPDGNIQEILDRYGTAPLPPYIKRPRAEAEDRVRYQTVYAKRPGAIAAPTAGLHFTPALLSEIRRRHVEVAYITLHVGYGTFKPVTVERAEEHKMEPEFYWVTKKTAEVIEGTRTRDGRVIAVGSTVLRALETAAKTGEIQPGHGWTDLYIYPGHKFRVVDALLTNFHLPRSTLFLLVCAFAGREMIMQAYGKAIEEKFRFYSYGDAMLII